MSKLYSSDAKEKTSKTLMVILGEGRYFRNELRSKFRLKRNVRGGCRIRISTITFRCRQGSSVKG